jgi:hypothetical protein
VHASCKRLERGELDETSSLHEKQSSLRAPESSAWARIAARRKSKKFEGVKAMGLATGESAIGGRMRQGHNTALPGFHPGSRSATRTVDLPEPERGLWAGVAFPPHLSQKTRVRNAEPVGRNHFSLLSGETPPGSSPQLHPHQQNTRNRILTLQYYYVNLLASPPNSTTTSKGKKKEKKKRKNMRVSMIYHDLLDIQPTLSSFEEYLLTSCGRELVAGGGPSMK